MSNETFEGATVEAALELAAEKLGVEKADLEHLVVEEKKDFWGTGGNTVSIEAWVRVAEPEPATEPETTREPEPAVAPEPTAGPVAESDSGADIESTAAPEPDGDITLEVAPTSSPDENALVDFPTQAALAEESIADAEPEAADSAEPSKRAPSGQTPGDEEVEPAAIAELLDQIFHDMEFDCSVEIESQQDGFLATVVGDDKEAVLEGNGRCLSALELIANNAFRHRLPAGNKVRVDAGDFRSRRDEELSDLALQVAHSAKESGRTQETQPLNPYERRLVHLALTDDSKVTTKSRGSGFLKNVQVIPQSRGDRGRGRRR